MAQSTSPEKYTGVPAWDPKYIFIHSFPLFSFLPYAMMEKGIPNDPCPQWSCQGKLLLFQVTGCDSQGLGSSSICRSIRLEAKITEASPGMFWASHLLPFLSFCKHCIEIFKKNFNCGKIYMCNIKFIVNHF